MSVRILSAAAVVLISTGCLCAQEPPEPNQEALDMEQEAKFREVRDLKTDKVQRIPIEQVQQSFDYVIDINTPKNLKLGEQFHVVFTIPELRCDEVEFKYEIGFDPGIRVIDGPAPVKALYRVGDVPKLECLIQKVAPGGQGIGIYVVFYKHGEVVGYGGSGRILNQSEMVPEEPALTDDAYYKRRDAAAKAKAKSEAEAPKETKIRN